jgi:hypothetical protein
MSLSIANFINLIVNDFLMVYIEPEKKKEYGVWIAFFVLVVLVVLLGSYIYFNEYKSSPPDCNSSYEQGFRDGASQGVNESIKFFLASGNNCSIVSINYEGNKYGFVDVTCLNR